MAPSFPFAGGSGRLKLRFSAGLAGVAALLSMTPGCFAQAAPGKAPAPYLDAAVPIQQRVDALVSKMTLAEKVSQMQNHAAAIPRLGIAEYDWWSEALHGVARSGYATVFPQAIGMAATWDAPLIHEEAHVIGIEGRGRYNSAVRENNRAIFYGMDFWSPNVNIFRDPRWGRGQETYGEDPFLTGQLGVQFVAGLQGDNPKYYLAISTPKHFDGHSGPESERHRFNVDVSAHDLEDTYLPAFRATIVDGHADSIMCAYNAVDGVPACANKMLLQQTLRGDWGFQGYVVSDCGAIGDIADGHKYAPSIEQASVDAVRAGTDLSCGDEYATLVKAVQDGLIQESEIDAAVKRLMTARIRMGILAPPSDQPLQSLNRSVVYSADHAKLDLRAADESMVLLKNDGALPLAANVKTVAVIGPNAASLAALEGNYNGTPIHPETPLAAFKTLAAQKRFRVLDVQGAPYVEQLSLPVPPDAFHTAGGAEGLMETAFPNTNFSGPGIISTSDNIDSNWDGASPYPNRIPRQAFSVRWSGTFTAPAAGDIAFQVKLADCYPCNNVETYSVWLDGKQVSSGTSHDNKGRGHAAEFHVHFADTRPRAFRLDYSHQSPLFGAGVSFNWQPQVEALRQQAVAAARQADAVVAFVGISPRLEGEEMPIHVAGFSGGDRTSIDLPDVQRQMLQAVAATGKPLIVVLMNGSALAVNWSAQHANAILEAWYPGARGGQAILDTLLGKNNPAGRLPVTFYTSTDDLPPFTDYSMADRTYRYYHGKTLYGFGYGLSYSNFRFGKLRVSTDNLQAGDSLTVDVDVTNTSKIAGDEVAELYLTYPETKTSPIHALAGFARVHVPAAATVPVRIKVDARQWSQVLANGSRVILPGSYTLFVGGSQPGPGANGVSTTVTISGKKVLPR
ncbi:MAG: glycoside hydrolase family 3 C-terminal domain-containing protein [Acidobacteriaceae bacterium]